MDRFRGGGMYVSTFPKSLGRRSGDEYRSIGKDGRRPFPRDRERCSAGLPERGEPGRYESMGRRGGERPLVGETVERLRGGGEGRGDMDFGGEDLTSKVSDDFLAPFASSIVFSICSNGFSAPF